MATQQLHKNDAFSVPHAGRKEKESVEDAAATSTRPNALWEPNASTSTSAAKLESPPAYHRLLSKEHALSDVDPKMSTIPLSAFCFMTGYIDAVSYTVCSVWCAFQTGNTLQLAIGLSRAFTPSNIRPFGEPERQALCALLAFLLGSFIGRIGDRIGPKRRVWLVLGTLFQGLLSLFACFTAHASRESSFAAERRVPSWITPLGFTSLAFISASVGLQSAMAVRLGTQFSNSVVLTTVWVQLVTEPTWFKLDFLPRRDHKILGILLLFIGGFLGRVLVNTVGVSSALAIASGFRVVIALMWYLVPAAKLSS